MFVSVAREFSSSTLSYVLRLPTGGVATFFFDSSVESS